MKQKEIAENISQGITDESGTDPDAYKLRLIAAVRQGLAELDNGESVPIDEVERELSSF